MLTTSISPRRIAAELRCKAEGLTGDAREHCLWLAREWDLTADRFRSIVDRAGETRPNALSRSLEL